MADEEEDRAIRMGQLIARRMTGQLSPDEDRELDDWLAESNENRALYNELLTDSGADYIHDLARIDDEAEFQQIREQYDGRQKPALRRMIPYAAAVAVLALAIGGWLLLVDSRLSPVDSVAAEEILPGGNRATLTLADGRVIHLDEAQTGIVVGTEDITYTDGSWVMGNEELRMENEKPILNSITTPKGGTYQVTLPDGSQVWLNANSTLKYPSRFSGDSRDVILEGEAFFAVSSRPSAIGNHPLAAGKGPKAENRKPTAERLPFRVLTPGQTVEVLGTQFNISAYPDESATKTTLVEGKVRLLPASRPVQTGPGSPISDEPVVLSPGEQAVLHNGTFTAQQVDVSSFVGWKDNNQFLFHHISLREILLQLQRWYDIDVDFGSVPDKALYGEISRDVPLSQVLTLIEEVSGITFELDGRRLKISE